MARSAVALRSAGLPARSWRVWALLILASVAVEATEATTALAAGVRSLDYALIGKVDCPTRFVPLLPPAGAKASDTTAAQMVRRFHKPVGMQACCVLDKAIGAIELHYSIGACAGFKKHQQRDAAAGGNTGTGTAAAAVSSPCFAGAVATLKSALASCCPAGAAGKACANAVVQPTQLVRNALLPRFRRCVATENLLLDSGDTSCKVAAHATVGVIQSLLAAAAKLYRSSVKDVTPDAADVLALCSDVKDCTARVRSFLHSNLGHKQLVVPQHAQWIENPTGCSQDVRLNCGYFDCPTATGATCVAEPPPTHAIAIGRGTKHLDGDVDIIVPPSKQTLPFDHAFSITAWLKTDPGGVGRMPAMTILAKTAPAEQQWKTHRGGKVLWITSTGKLRFDVGAARHNHMAESVSSVADGKWHSLALVYSADPVAAIALGSAAASGTVTLYIDGRLEAHGKMPLPADPPGARLKIGFCNLDFPPAGTYFRGTLGDIVYWKHAIDLEKVQQEAKGQPGGNRECMCPARMCAKELKQHAMWQPGIVKYHCVHATGA